MTIPEIQSAPYNLKHKQYLLSSSEIESTSCFVGEIEKLKTLKIGVVGIFLSETYDSFTDKTETTFLKSFYYDCPKFEFKNEHCPEATHFLITSDFDPTEQQQKTFLQKLAVSKINKEQMKEPCQDPFDGEYFSTS